MAAAIAAAKHPTGRLHNSADGSVYRAGASRFMGGIDVRTSHAICTTQSCLSFAHVMPVTWNNHMDTITCESHQLAFVT